MVYGKVFILSWIEKNLVNTEYPRKQGKALKGDLSAYWRYRVGNYRLIAEIKDNTIEINIINIRHRKDIYKKM
ncbi:MULTISPECIES: type II toxin-antitoxin system RelE family toxin [Aerococcus]|uniref:type II toxin-antitoxin system RelE family toxin n=1 Tax=Aerococcus TaxID=1375 RepID=UPI0018A74490|nr:MULTISPECIES: type II toxin-antitoxin system RelE/ParE family toxin [Aerococcus]MCY3067574.1 type II toxin-antitoxin system RelE/ParE family toxin [Aerococcus mictus]MCY3080891.1 type II toxin-antitoxin system RelE/ParE family toxin [Aerococcus mictus]MDK8485528.1 type II toxin-antitoxin system RelE/ParE family toxin [Aerococcus urinae]